MSEKYVWRMIVTDAQGHKNPSSDDALPNPYISDESAQNVADRVLALIVPGHAAQEPGARSVEVQVWQGRDHGGDPIATAEWHRPATP